MQNKIKIENISAVKLVGPLYGDSKWSFLHSGDIFVLPSYSENFGIVIAESLAIGVPVITTTSTPWKELEKFKCGWWIDLSISNLVKALNEAVNCQPEILKEMGLRGQKLIKDKYDIKSVALEMNALYNRLIV